MDLTSVKERSGDSRFLGKLEKSTGYRSREDQEGEDTATYF